jgi:hypothetical protein
MPLEWKVDERSHAPDHMRAITPFGEYLIGPRRSDGAWEYATPDEDWGEHDNHMLEDLTRGQAFYAAEAEFVERSARSPKGGE